MDVYGVNFADPNNNPVAKISSLGSILNILIPFMTVGAGLIFLMMLITGAFMYVTSGDNAEGVKKAQATMFSAVMGLVIVISAYLVAKLISWFFKIELPI
ncbi:hypothetical protein HZC27_01930 [Candidatus Roizmanbacteria bacterium]|nr:hypothetical protein [Candidatus Roizmanbacteria bacterium]